MSKMDTGWKMPGSINQDFSTSVNNGTCYRFNNLTNILIKGTEKYADQTEWKAGVNNRYASPIIYAYNYNFKIPTNATITKINVRCTSCRQTYSGSSKLYTKTMKLKLGASVTDGGSGTNVASQDQNAYNIRTWREYVYKGDQNTWGINVTPGTLNSTNFGCVYQIGNKNSSWGIPRVALMEMKIEYTVPTATITTSTTSENVITKTEVPANSTLIESPLFNIYISQDDEKDNLDIFFNNYSTLTIEYVHKVGSNGLYNSGSTPETLITSDDLYINKVKTSYSVPTTLVKESTTSTTIVKKVKVYPGTLIGEQTLEVTYGTTTKSFTYTVKDSTEPGELVDSTPFSNPAQKFYVRGCTFKNNSSGNTAGAIHMEGSHATVTSSSGSGNTAASSDKCNNIMWNGECKSFTSN